MKEQKQGIIMNFLKQLICKHVWEQWQKTSRITDEIIHKGQERHCAKCGKVKYK